MFAAYTAYTDHEIGRVIQAVEDMGKLDNTLIIYICGDNGTSPEGTLLGTPNQYTAYNGILDVPVEEQLKFYDVWGSAPTYPHMAVAWSWAFDTPFKWTKQVASHFGGTRQGMAISWPARIKDAGGIRTQFHHIIDIVPTILEATGIQAPEMVDGIAQKPIEGVSMVVHLRQGERRRAVDPHRRSISRWSATAGSITTAGTPTRRRRSPPWVLNAPMPDVDDYKWELYNLTEDYSQANDLAAKMPDKLKEMQALFAQEAKKYNVYPLDNSQFQRAITPRPSATAGQTVFTYSGEMPGIPTGNAPSILNRSFTITAEVEVPQGGGDGMIVTEGGWCGRLRAVPAQGQAGVHLQPASAPAAPAGQASRPLTPGKHTIVFDFTYDGPGIAKGGTGVLKVDGQEVAYAEDPADDPVPDAGRRDLRRRGRHPHGGERPGLPGAVPLQRHDRQADLQARADTIDRRSIGIQEANARARASEWPRRGGPAYRHLEVPAKPQTIK